MTEEKKYTIEEFKNYLYYFDDGFKGDSVEILLSDLTPEAIEKANRINDENQIKLNIK